MTTETAATRAEMGKRIYGLDILRSIAILTVVLAHSSYFLDKNKVVLNYYSLLCLDGVTIFFVLSGFLIGGIFLKILNKPVFTFKHLLRFWIRRWFRTLPNYYLMLIILIPCWVAIGQPLPPELYKYFFFLQNFHTRHPNFFSEAWSLCVEEWFYLLVPLIIFLTAKLTKFNRNSIVLFYVLFFVVFCTAIRFYRISVYHYTDEMSFDLYIKKQVITRLDSLMFGVLGAYLAFFYNAIWLKHRNILFIIGALLLISLQFNGLLYHSTVVEFYGGITASSVGTLLLLPRLVSVVSGNGMLYRALTTISKISYSMYLIHASFMIVVVFPHICKAVDHFTANNYIRAITEYILFWLSTIATSYLVYRFYEHPITNLRDKVKI